MSWQKIDIRFKILSTGRLQPHIFWEHDTPQYVMDCGRRWMDEEGEHVLVMTYQDQVWELLDAQDGSGWYLKILPPTEVI